MALIQSKQRLLAPIVLLSGHHEPITNIDFHSQGRLFASSAVDGEVLVWKMGLVGGTSTDNGEIKSISLLQHKQAVLDVKFSRDESELYTASADHYLYRWNVFAGERLKRYVGHEGIINSCSVFSRGTEKIVTASDDGTCLIWSSDEKYSIQAIEHKFPVLSTAWSKDGQCIYSAGIDNQIYVHDIRHLSVPIYQLFGHVDSISGLSVSNDGNSLVSTAMDNTIKVWDLKPFAINPDRLICSFEVAHGFEKNLIRPCFSNKDEFIACGSGDRSVTVWNLKKQRISYKLPGHKGCVNTVAWHPHVDIICSGSTDRTMYLGELNLDQVR